MNNPETLATLGLQDTGQRRAKHNTKKLKILATWTPPKARSGPGVRIGKEFLLLIRHTPCNSYIHSRGRK